MILGTLTYIALFVTGLSLFGLSYIMITKLPREWVCKVLGITEDEIALPNKK